MTNMTFLDEKMDQKSKSTKNLTPSKYWSKIRHYMS